MRAQPFRQEGEDLLLLSLLDISGEKRRAVLERLFFHDVLNSAGGLRGLLHLLALNPAFHGIQHPLRSAL
mgnify:CR=1 FL=1